MGENYATGEAKTGIYVYTHTVITFHFAAHFISPVFNFPLGPAGIPNFKDRDVIIVVRNGHADRLFRQ
jgi:cytochrome c oxidase assembly factor CtaG